MANHYLLLRRNKQTGPYTIDELQKLPLEPYDLVWIEGISDSWKYPGEINELKSFAPYTGNLKYNFNSRKPGVTEDLRPTQPAVQLPADKKYSPEETPASETPQHQDARSTPGNNDRSIPSTSSLKKESNQIQVQPRYPVSKRRDLKKAAMWAIPIALLFFLGLWIGTNWNQFPANEGVSVPLTNNNRSEKNGAATYEERKNGITTSDNAAPAIILPEEPLIDETVTEENADQSATGQSTDIDNEILVDDDNNEGDIEAETVKPVEKTNERKAITPATAGKTNTTPEPASKTDAVRTTTTASSTTSKPSVVARTPTTGRVVSSRKSTDVTKGNNHQSTKESSQNKVAQTNQVGMTKRSLPVASNNRQVDVNNTSVPESYMSKKLVPVDHLVDVDGNYKKNENGKGVKEVDFTVYNRSGKYLKAVKLEIQYIGKNNTLLKKQNMKFFNISSDGAVKIDADGHNNAERIGYKVLFISSTIGDFYYEPVEFLSSVSR